MMNVQETPLRQESCQARTVSVLLILAAVLSSSQAPIEKTRASYSVGVVQPATFAHLHLYAS
jgi:hypothetical protein